MSDSFTSDRRSSLVQRLQEPVGRERRRESKQEEGEEGGLTGSQTAEGTLARPHEWLFSTRCRSLAVSQIKIGKKKKLNNKGASVDVNI